MIGLGVMGRRMAAAMETHDRFHVTRAWDPSPDACRAAARIPIAASGAEVTSASDVDAVYVATPPAAHAGFVLGAVEAGKAVFCEKPLTVDLAEGRKLVAEVARARAANAVNFPFAADPSIATLERCLREGEAGDFHRVEIRLHFSEWPRAWQRGAATWLAGRKEGGFVREVFSHFAYLTRRLVGPMATRASRVAFAPEGTETRVVAEMEAAGIPVEVTGGVGGVAPDAVEWTLYGTRRSFRLVDWGRLLRGDTAGWQELPPDAPPKPDLGDQLDALAAMLRGEPHALPDLAEGLAVAEVVEELLRG